MKITCEFKLRRYENKDKFILEFKKPVARKAISFARHPGQSQELEAVGYLALCAVPYEVADRMTNFDIVPYLFSRVRTRCREFVRKDFTIRIPNNAYHLIKTPFTRSNKISIEECGTEDMSVRDLEEILNKVITTELERLIVHHLRQGDDKTTIAHRLGCSCSKITRTHQKLEQKFDEYISSLRKHDGIRFRPR